MTPNRKQKRVQAFGLVSQERSGLQIQSHQNVLPPLWNTVETALQGAFASLIPLELNEVLALPYRPGIEIKRAASKPSSLVPVCGCRREQGPLWPGYQLPWPSLWLLQLQGSGGIAAPAASISFSFKACTTPFGGISPVMLSYELETPYQCHIMRRRRLCPNATVSGTAEPEASLDCSTRFLCELQGQLAYGRLSTDGLYSKDQWTSKSIPRWKLLPGGDLHSQEPGWWPTTVPLSLVWTQNQNSSNGWKSGLLSQAWPGHVGSPKATPKWRVCIWSQILYQRKSKELQWKAKEIWSQDSSKMCAWLYVLSYEIVTGIIQQEICTCMTFLIADALGDNQ